MIASAMWLADGKTIAVTFDDEISTVMFVPDDMANRHRQELEEWMKIKGNIIQPYVPPAPPPEVAPTTKKHK